MARAYVVVMIVPVRGLAQPYNEVFDLIRMKSVRESGIEEALPTEREGKCAR